MFPLSARFLGLAVLLASLPLLAQNSAAPSAPTAPTPAVKATARQKHVSKRTKRHPQQPYRIPPMTPELLPANPPQVSYQNGQLTIQSVNSTLADILRAVRARTGAEIETPAGFGNERVAARLGPGSAREVLVALLSGANFGYVIVGRPDNSGGVQKLIVTGVEMPLNAGGSSGLTATGNRPPPQPNPEADMEEEPEPPQPAVAEQPPPPPPAPPPGSPGNTPGVMQPNLPPDIQAAQPSQPGQPPPPGPPGQPQTGQPGQNPNQPQVKTPEELLQELQRRQQQR